MGALKEDRIGALPLRDRCCTVRVSAVCGHLRAGLMVKVQANERADARTNPRGTCTGKWSDQKDDRGAERTAGAGR